MADETTSSGSTMPNVWQLTAGTHNPYLHNLFVLLSLSAEASEDDITESCRRLRQKLDGGGPLEVHGHKLSEFDVARGEQLAADADQLAAQRLLVHTPHKLDLTPFQQAFAELDRQPLEKPERLLPLPVVDVSFLTRLLPDAAELQPTTAPPIAPEQCQALFEPRVEDEHVYAG